MSRNGIKVCCKDTGSETMMKGNLERRPLADGDRVVVLWAQPILSYTFRLTNPRTLASE